MYINVNNVHYSEYFQRFDNNILSINWTSQFVMSNHKKLSLADY